jgi:hypothetical protein
VRGYSRIELAPKARAMRAEGLMLKEISAALGVPISTLQAWIDDPDCSKQRSRRARYAGSCLDCGCPTDGSAGPGRAPQRCNDCANQRRTAQAREAIIEAIRRWAEEHGGIPPRATDWNVAMARSRGEDTRDYENGDWRATSGVTRAFGTWNAAIEAAGYEPTPVGKYARF